MPVKLRTEGIKRNETYSTLSKNSSVHGFCATEINTLVDYWQWFDEEILFKFDYEKSDKFSTKFGTAKV